MIKKLGGLFGRNPTFKNVTIEGVLNTIFGAVSSGAALTADTDTSLAANSDSNVATQKAIKAYVDGVVTGLLDFKGGISCSANPNYPTALKGDAYVVTTAGKIGGVSGIAVAIGDMVIASADNAGGTQAAVGSSWFALEKNLDGALLSANNLSDLANAATARTNLGLGSAATTAATDYAVAAKGVTNGDSHDHNGGDGAQIAYGGLSGLPSLGTISSQNANAVVVTGGSINGTPVGGSTPASGAFTSIAGNSLALGGGNISPSVSSIRQAALGSNRGLFIFGPNGNLTDGCIDISVTASSVAGIQAANNSVYTQLQLNPNGGDVYIGANLVVGTSGKGIDFSADGQAAGMTSELLNDYEEGSWAPSVYDALTGGNKSSTNGGGSYTKIGRQVTVRFNIDAINTAGLTAGNEICIGSLPFTAGTSAQGSFYTYRVGGGAAQSASLTLVGSYTRARISLYSGNSATTDVNLKVSDLVSGVSSIGGTITYFI